MNPPTKTCRAGSQPSFACIDVTLRDGHQCLWSTRMTTAMMTPILSTLDRVGYAYINILGGAVFDVCVRYLHENPWERVQLLCQHLTTPCDALTRGQSLYTFALFPDDVVALNAQVLARLGIKVLTVYDALNDNRNIASSVRAGHNAGMQVNAMVTYTLSPVHTDAYYVARTRELVQLQADFISIKDPTGLLTPERARTLFPAVVQAAGTIPVQLHSHCQSGLAPDVYTVAIEQGFRFGYTAVEPLANGASLPSTAEIARRAGDVGYSTGLDHAALAEVSAYFDWLCVREGKPRGQVARYDPALYEHQVPGGMISNLRSQLQMMQMEERLPEILTEAAQVRRDLGYPILVSPFAQYVITQAVLNVVQGERYKTIPDEVRKYAMGYYGTLAAPPSDVFLERAAIRPGDMVTDRPGEHVPAGLPRLRAALGTAATDADLLLAAFYDAKLLEPLRRPAPSYTFSTTPLFELIRYLGMQNDITYARVKFAGTELTLSA
ncbi:MAG: pyruvate carboxylase subunit B [Candidatus Tectomicrobia bacterium]|uniref:Pyruvate carboxylase subunit B n=1 Tax=Tectimicrobiota bacterium TaxID=2528274 RepID=A0A937W5M4_UNCTE|nr:pyruvate carboxylase subunit B [Candidatus Tectomicrobia bacterium]